MTFTITVHWYQQVSNIPFFCFNETKTGTILIRCRRKKLVECGKILLNLVFKRKLGKLLNLVTQFHFCIGRVGISTLVKFVLVFYWRVQRLLKEMQGQVTFLNQNGLIPFGITNPKTKRQKHVVLTENFSLFFSKNVFFKHCC